MSHHRIRLGDLVLSDGQNPLAAGDDFAYRIMGENIDNGAPEPIEVTIRTFLQDGARVVTQGYGNREVRFILTITGPDSASLARGEEALAAQMGVRNELGITPPDGWAPESVFDVETSSFGHNVDDVREVVHTQRVYSLRFVCQPFVRPATTNTVEAIPVSGATPVVDVIDDGTATTRWTARIGTLSDQGSFLRIAETKTPRAVWTGAAPFDLTSRHYVSLDIKAPAATGYPRLLADGVDCELVASVRSTYTRHTFRVVANTVASMEFVVDLDSFGNVMDFKNLTASNVPPYSGTTKQTTRSLAVAGSARTQGSLALVAESGALGEVLVYTTTATVGSPSLRPYRVSGGSQSANPGAVSGTVESAAATYEVPVADIAPGKHQLLVRLNSPGGGDINIPYSLQMKTSAGLVGPVTSGTVKVSPTTGFGLYAIENFDLPLLAVPDESTAVVSITLGGSPLTFDDWYLLNLDKGAVTIIEAGTATRAWLESPTVAQPNPVVYVGTQADRSDAVGAFATISAWGTHTFKGDTTVFLMTSGSSATAATFEYFRRYFNFVPGDA